MSKTKSKSTSQPRHNTKKARPKSADSSEGSRAQSLPQPEDLAQQQYWREEIKALKEQKFKNSSEALHTLVEKVLDKFDLEPKQLAETRDFLMLLLDTDETIKEELSKMLKLD